MKRYSRPSEPGRETSGKLVLVVDDDPGIQELLELALRTEGYQVISARDGREALERIAEIMPDVVVLDLMMPRLDGPGFLAETKRIGIRDQLSVMVLSAASRGKDHATELGAEAYIDKPFSLHEFLEEVSRLAA